MATPRIFGQNPFDTVPQPYSFFGQAGWWLVPTQWCVESDANLQIWCSPNANPANPATKPRYAVKRTTDGSFVFQDLYRTLQTIPPATIRG
jgi:hypothetical protein